MKIVYKIPVPNSPESMIEVYGEPEKSSYEWRIIEQKNTAWDTGSEDGGFGYESAEEALRYALSFNTKSFKERLFDKKPGSKILISQEADLSVGKLASKVKTELNDGPYEIKISSYRVGFTPYISADIYDSRGNSFMVAISTDGETSINADKPTCFSMHDPVDALHFLCLLSYRLNGSSKVNLCRTYEGEVVSDLECP